MTLQNLRLQRPHNLMQDLIIFSLLRSISFYLNLARQVVFRKGVDLLMGVAVGNKYLFSHEVIEN